MKKIFLPAILACAVQSVTAQYEFKAKINLYTAFAFDDKYSTYYDANSYYNGKISGGFQWGTGIEYRLQPHFYTELMYIRHDTKTFPVYKAGPGNEEKTANLDIVLNHLMLGAIYHLGPEKKPVEANMGLYGGCLIAQVQSLDNGGYKTAYKFAWGTKLGCTIRTGKKFAVMIQGLLLSCVRAAGGEFYFGSPASNTGLATYATFYQISLGAGVTFDLDF